MKTVKIIRENNEIKFSIPDGIFDISELQRFVDYIRLREITAKSKATPEDVENLANEINESWWKKNKSKFEK